MYPLLILSLLLAVLAFMALLLIYQPVAFVNMMLVFLTVVTVKGIIKYANSGKLL